MKVKGVEEMEMVAEETQQGLVVVGMEMVAGGIQSGLVVVVKLWGWVGEEKPTLVL